MSLQSFLLICLGLINVLFGILVLLRNSKRAANITFLALTVSVGLWCIGIGAFYSSQDPAGALNWTRLYYAAPALLVYSLVLFAKSFPDKFLSKKQVLAWGVPLFAFLLMLMLDKHLIISGISVVGGVKDVVLNTVSYLPYAIYIVVYFTIGLLLLLSKSKGNGLHAKQAALFFVGSLLSAILGVCFNLILPAFGNYRLIWAGPLATSIFIGVVAFGMTRYKMFDIRGFVLRATAYSFTTLFLAVLYIAPIVALSVYVLNVSVSPQKFILSIVIFTIAAVNYQRLGKWFDKVTNRVFFRDMYDPAKLLSDLNRTLVSEINLTDVIGKTAALIEKNFNPEYCVFLVKNAQGEFVPIHSKSSVVPTTLDVPQMVNSLSRMHRRSILVDAIPPNDAFLSGPLLSIRAAFVSKISPNSKTAPVAFLLLGSRESGRVYTAQDAQVIDALGGTLIIAIQNALHYEETKSFNVTLQERVEQATKELRKTNDKLKKLDETKDEFISMASHQLRTPLTSVKGYLSMVLEGDAGELNDLQRQLLGQSYSSSQRMVYLISDLLNLSRLNTGKFVIEPAEVDLREVVAAEIDQLRETAKSRGVSIVYNAPQSFPVLMLDETKTHQVVMNFLDNAIYYTPTGGEVHVSLVETATAVEYRVKDSGIGVPRSEQHRLFSKFYRAENARRVRPDGTGLGLFMSKKVVVAQGGSIIFESEEGKGSTFGFRFGKAGHAVAPPRPNQQ